MFIRVCLRSNPVLPWEERRDARAKQAADVIPAARFWPPTTDAPLSNGAAGWPVQIPRGNPRAIGYGDRAT
jgi:hypothetical protein